MTKLSPPPSRIYLVRHAEAVRAGPGERDFDRGLSDEGYSEAEIVADKAADMGFTPDLVLCSTAARCRQTAEAFRRSIGEETLRIEYVDSLYNAPMNVYLDILSSQDAQNSLMLIGHNPTIEQILETLIGDEALAQAIPNGYPTGAMAVVDASTGEQSATAWILSSFLTA